MTAKRVILNEDDKKIWGWYDSEGGVFGDKTRAQAEREALNAKAVNPDATIVVFKMVATIENKPYIKGI